MCVCVCLYPFTLAKHRRRNVLHLQARVSGGRILLLALGWRLRLLLWLALGTWRLGSLGHLDTPFPPSQPRAQGGPASIVKFTLSRITCPVSWSKCDTLLKSIRPPV